jgi:hypothetical protein
VKKKTEHICTICGDSFFSKGATPRHKCQGEFKGKTGTGIAVDELPEIPEIEEALEIEVEEDIAEDQWEPATLELPTPDPDAEPEEDYVEPQAAPGPQEFAKGAQAPPATKKDRSKMEDLVGLFIAAFDSNQYTTEQKTIIISNVFADTLDVRVETTQVVISQLQFGIVSALGVVLLLGKDKFKPVFENYRSQFFNRETSNIDDPFGEE